MSSNSRIRNLHFAQGVEIALPPDILDASDTIDLPNNLVTVPPLTFDIADYREIIIDYSIRRRTDTPFRAVERGRMRLTADPDGIVDVTTWILSWDFKNDEGVPPQVVFSINITAGVVSFQIAVANVAGANHHCYFSYALTTFLV